MDGIQPYTTAPEWWLLGLVGLLLSRAFGEGGEATGYRFVELVRGDVEETVSSTGTLDALTAVQVGTQVSGQVPEIFVDVNDRITKGRPIARIDPTLLSQAVRSAQADLEPRPDRRLAVRIETRLPGSPSATSRASFQAH